MMLPAERTTSGNNNLSLFDSIALRVSKYDNRSSLFLPAPEPFPAAREMRAFLSLTALVLFPSPNAAVNVSDWDHGMTLGVDYYPEQWPLESMQADMRSIRIELGADTIRIGEFMWGLIEPEDGEFDFSLMDKIMDSAEAEGLRVMLGTPTATMPAWLAQAHPDVLKTGPDSPEGYMGATASFGGRRQYSFNSQVYLSYAARVTAAVAERYGQRKVVKFWQVDNEIGHEGSDLDFGDNALSAWRSWLVNAYAQDVGALNVAWGTVFWGATYSEFSQIPLPKWTVPGTSPRPNEIWRSNMSPGMLLDYRRFRRDSVTEFTKTMLQELRSSNDGIGVHGHVTTNAPGGFWEKALDHNDIFSTMDLAAFDNYPVWGGSTEAPLPSTIAVLLDTVRGWHEQLHVRNGSASDLAINRQGGWMVAEQLIGAQGHDIIGFTPRPGQV